MWWPEGYCLWFSRLRPPPPTIILSGPQWELKAWDLRLSCYGSRFSSKTCKQISSLSTNELLHVVEALGSPDRYGLKEKLGIGGAGIRAEGGGEFTHILVEPEKGESLRQDLRNREDGPAVTDLTGSYRSSPTLASRDSRGFTVPKKRNKVEPFPAPSFPILSLSPRVTRKT